MVNWIGRLFFRKKEKKFATIGQRLINDLNEKLVTDFREHVRFRKETDEQKRSLEVEIRELNTQMKNATVQNQELHLENSDLRKKARKRKVERLSIANPECDICVVPFDDSELQSPRVLACGHTLCLACALSSHNGSSINCPFCRLITGADVPGVYRLPKNVSLMMYTKEVDTSLRAQYANTDVSP